MIMKLICKPAGLHCIFWAAKKSYLFIQGQNGFWPRNIKNAWLGDYFDRWQKYAQGIPWQSVINQSCNHLASSLVSPGSLVNHKIVMDECHTALWLAKLYLTGTRVRNFVIEGHQRGNQMVAN